MINKTLLYVCFVLSQAQAQKTGTILDFGNIPVENATIYVLKNSDTIKVTSSDEKGKFEFDTIEDELDLLITHIGYKKLMVKFIAPKGTYYLESRINYLNSVEIENTSKKKSLLERVGKIFQSCGRNLLFEDELATFIPATEENLEKKISQLKFELTDNKGVKNNKYLPFRACIYTVDPVTGKPDKKIYRSEKVSMKKPQKWFRVDIDTLDIRMPDEGLFIAVEALPGDAYNNQRIGTIYGWWVDATPTIKCRIAAFKEENPTYHFLSLLCSNNRRTMEECWISVEGQYYMEFEF